MPNIVKYNLSTSPNSIQSGNFNIGVNNTPTNLSQFYTGICPIIGGYTIYINKASNGPSIYAPKNDTQLIEITNNLGGNVTTATEALVWINSQSTMTVLNNNYPSIVTDGLVMNLDAGFVSSYPKTGTTWKDLSGDNYDGTLVNGPTFSNDGGGSIVFDGSDDFVQIPYSTYWDTNVFGTATNFTLECWYKPDLFKNWDTLIEKSESSGWYSRSEGAAIWTNSGNIQGVFASGVDGNPGGSVIVLSYPTTTLKWYHIVFNGNGTVLSLYVDGVLRQTGLVSSRTVAVYNGSVGPRLGRRDFMDGQMSSVRFYTRALTQQEVLQNYYAGLQRFIPTDGLVLSLDAQNTNLYAISPTTAYDVSGNNNNGTLINGVQYVGDGDGSWKFDGTDDYMNVSHNTSLNLTSQGTISTWINPAVLTQGWYANIVAKNTGGSVNQQSYTLSWRQVSGVLFGQICNGSGTYNEVYGSFPTVANVWYNIVFTWNGSQLVMYNNGVVVGTSTQTINNQVLVTDLTIGGYTYKGAGGGDEYFNGKISQTYIYNRGLTQAEVTTMYNATKSRYGL
jgi:hypothetical protein